MTFQSHAFLLGFLPFVLAGSAALRAWAPGWLKPCLIAVSLGFFASWGAAGLPFFLASIAGNRLATQALHRATAPGWRRLILGCATAGNLGLLVWFRYLTAWLGGLDAILGTGLAFAEPLALLGVSFFTFTQIGYLLDCHAGIEPPRPLADHLLFVTFFPSLIAGPILTAREMMPQIATLERRPVGFEDLARGGGIFLIGLLKKTLLADPLAPIVAAGHADPAALSLFGAWQVGLGYFLQLYFDFSGYSDMAVGLARMAGLRYPWNFASPYQARGVIEYWQRWHISLTRFFMATLHAPLAMAILRWRRTRGLGVDRAAQRRPAGFVAMHAVPLAVTMALAGVWHGASLTFLVFGLLHALFLSVNHLWRLLRPGPPRGGWRAVASVGLTCLCVLIGSVFFRASSVGAACDLLAGMAGAQGTGPLVLSARVLAEAATLAALLGIVWCAPNTRRIMEDDRVWSWRPTPAWAVASGIATTLGLLSAGGTAEFLYARF